MKYMGIFNGITLIKHTLSQEYMFW